MNAHNTYKKIISDTNRVKGNVHNEGTHYHVHRYHNFHLPYQCIIIE